MTKNDDDDDDNTKHSVSRPVMKTGVEANPETSFISNISQTVDKCPV
jgi:hypothetical protein